MPSFSSNVNHNAQVSHGDIDADILLRIPQK